jgi:hypothetical protein
MLDKQQILELFIDLNNKLHDQGLNGEIGVVGGAALCLLFNERVSTKDVDAIFEPTTKIRQLVKEIAEERHLADDWLNDAVKGFFPDVVPQEQIMYDGDSLKVWVPNLEYLFAMKSLASRADTTDLSDIKLLIKKIPIATFEEAIKILHSYYPKGRISQKTYYFLEELFS